MQVVKYFYEEPIVLERLSPDSDPDARRQAGPVPTLDDYQSAPRYARGYLAASDLETGRIGASVLPESITAILDAVLPMPRLHYTSGSEGVAASRLESADDLREALGDRAPRSVILSGPAPADEQAALKRQASIQHVVQSDNREALGPITDLLEVGATVLIAEPSHDGHDWTVFSPTGLANEIRSAMAERLKGVAGFVIPYAKARGEHRFYFEQYDLDLFHMYRVSA